MNENYFFNCRTKRIVFTKNMGYWNYVVLIWLNSFIFVSGVQNGWRPIKSKPDFVIGPRIIYGAKKIPLLQTCSLHKAVMDQHSFHQVCS